MRTPELSALVSRLRWPVPAVKWWVVQQLALMLLDPDQRASTENELLHALGECRFETEAVELLFVFWLAIGRDSSFKCRVDLGRHLAARSLLSDALLKSIDPGCTVFGKYLMQPSAFPAGLVEPIEFLMAEGQAFPPVLRSVLSYIEEKTGFPFQMQFASEWQGSLARVPNHRHRIDFFLGSPSDQYTGQFFTEQSARGRSAFLRTLSVAGPQVGLSSKHLERFALSTVPLDPALAWLQSSSPLVGLELGGANQPDVGIEKHIKQVLSAANETGLIGAISWVADFSEGVCLDCSATLWEGPSMDWPDNRPLDRATKLYAGMLTGAGLARFATCSYTEDEVYEDPAGFRPLAGLADTSRYGYMQAEIFVRSIFLPVLSTTIEPVIAVPMGNLIAYRRGANTVGHFGYWNISWAPSHLRSGGPRCGTFLILTERDVRKRAFYTWHCRRFTGKQGYGEVEHEDMYGILALEV